jgi:hypothetical protein
MNCIITVEARGDLRKTKTGPVKDFIRDLTLYYEAVFDHCKSCKNCDPNEILRAFLKNRETPNKRGYTSGVLVKLAVKFLKSVPNTDPKLVREFLLRTDSFQTMIVNLKILSQLEILNILRNIYHDRTETSKLAHGTYSLTGVRNTLERHPFDSFISELAVRTPRDKKGYDRSEKLLFVKATMVTFNKTGIPTNNEEAFDLISVAEVMIS